MFQGLVDTVLGFVQQYGYVAVFVYMVLETAFLLHYVPSEVVVPFAAAQLVHDPISFVLFVLDATAGSTLGSVLAYVLFGHYGREILERYGHVLHVSSDRLDWSEDVFVRYGESSVFWGRLLPFLRAFISIPAGLAEMDLRRFVVYSAAGALLFNTGLAYLVYSGGGATTPLELVVSEGRAVVAAEIAYVQMHTAFVLVLAAITVVIGAAVWLTRHWIQSHPEAAKQATLHVVRIVGLLVGGAFVLGSLSAPDRVFTALTSVWNDPLVLIHLGFTERVALFLTGVVVAFAGVLVYELGQVFEIAHVETAIESLRNRMRNR